MTVRETHCVMHWMQLIYPVNIIHHKNNCGLDLRGPARVNSDKRHDPKSSDRAWNEIATRDNLPVPNRVSDGKVENKRQRTVVWLIYHQSECQEEVVFVNFPCASENISCQWASVDPPVNCANCEWSWTGADSCHVLMYGCSIRGM